MAATTATQLSKARAEGALVVSAPVFVELSAIPTGDAQRVEKLLREMNVAVDFNLEEDVWRFAATSFAAYAVSPPTLWRRFTKALAGRLHNCVARSATSRQAYDPRRQPLQRGLSESSFDLKLLTEPAVASLPSCAPPCPGALAALLSADRFWQCEVSACPRRSWRKVRWCAPAIPRGSR